MKTLVLKHFTFVLLKRSKNVFWECNENGLLITFLKRFNNVVLSLQHYFDHVVSFKNVSFMCPFSFKRWILQRFYVFLLAGWLGGSLFLYIWQIFQIFPGYFIYLFWHFFTDFLALNFGYLYICLSVWGQWPLIFLGFLRISWIREIKFPWKRVIWLIRKN